MIFWCQSCGEQHTSPYVASANITVCAKCGGQNFATWQPNRQSPSLESVRSEALEPPWQRTRREVLIEAAMKCRDIQYEHLGPQYDNVAENVKTYHNGMAKGADCCEYAIRQLADREDVHSTELRK